MPRKTADNSTKTTKNNVEEDQTNHNPHNFIMIRGASENNLKDVDIDVPKNKFVVITGPSGSGKSSLAFDTIYKEGQRRYVESLSSYARYFMNNNNKPAVESIKGLSPAIAIDQKTTMRNPRSTVGTTTEIYDLMRLLWSRIGHVFSPKTGEELVKYNKHEIISKISCLPVGTKIRIIARVINCKKGSFVNELLNFQQHGYNKAKIDGHFVSLEQIPELNPSEEHTIELVVDRIIIKENMGSRINETVEKCLKMSNNVLILDVVELPNGKNKCELKSGGIVYVGEPIEFSTVFADENSDFVLEEKTPKIFSFNNPYGACPDCHGLGTEVFFKEDLIVPDPKLSLMDGAIEYWAKDNPRYHNEVLVSLSKKLKFSLKTPYEDLPEKVKHILMYGLPKGETIKLDHEEDMRREEVDVQFFGVIGELQAKYSSADTDPLILEECEKYQTLTNCHSCGGLRLNKNVLQVKVAGKNIGEISALPIDEANKWFSELSSKISKEEQNIANPIIKEITTRLKFLENVGLSYLSILRSVNTLSGGEAQRIRLVTQLGSGLCDVIYVLDEPSIGLHQSDNWKLIKTLKDLRDQGNSVIVIEHDEEMMRSADYIIDVGPGAGKYGGEIVSKGTLKEIIHEKSGMTGMFLSGEMKIETPKARRKFGNGEFIELTGARENNLKNVDIKIPLGMFVAITGVSGGGKSTLILDTLYPAIAQQISRVKVMPGKFDKLIGVDNIDKILKIDQDPIGRTPRSNPATYIGLFTMIRDLFASLPQSLKRDYKPNRFSFNAKGGRCENCQGDGMIKIEMNFLPDVYVPCPVCGGKRYNDETLEVKYKGYSISDILNLSVREALEVFDDEIFIKEKLATLYNVGLDYIKLGQSSTTLSGGEAQRIRLAKELSKKATGNTLYILDEPTTGLHSCDIKRLLTVLHKLVDYGNTVLVIEHNLDVIKTADYIIDIGPVGGVNGGKIVAEGTPEEICKNKNSVTGEYLKTVM